MTDHGRSDASASSGSRPVDGANSSVVSTADAASIPNADNYAPIFRRGMGTAIEAVDCLRSRWRKSRKLSPTSKQFDEALDQLLDQLAQDSRIPWMIRDYHDANDASNSIAYGFRHLAGVLAGTASGTLTEGGDAKQAPGDSLSGAVPQADAQPPVHKKEDK